MPLPLIREDGAERIRQMAARRWGVTVPEVQEEFDIESYRTAWRIVNRLCEAGVLRRTDEHRRRTEVFIKVHGRGGRVYRSRRQVKGVQEWGSSRRQPGRRLSRGR